MDARGRASSGYAPLPWGVVAQTTAELVIGASIGALLGGLRRGGRGMLRFALFGAASFALPFAAMEGILLPIREAYQNAAQPFGPIALLVFVTPFGAVVGALLGIAFQCRESRDTASAT